MNKPKIIITRFQKSIFLTVNSLVTLCLSLNMMFTPFVKRKLMLSALIKQKTCKYSFFLSEGDLNAGRLVLGILKYRGGLNAGCLSGIRMLLRFENKKENFTAKAQNKKSPPIFLLCLSYFM